MSYYATGNFGYGTKVLGFNSKADRDYFVAWGKADQRSIIARKDAAKHYKVATFYGDGDCEPEVIKL